MNEIIVENGSPQLVGGVKSADKLEIQIEEQILTCNKTSAEESGESIQNEGKDSTQKVTASEDSSPSKKSSKKSKLSIRIPQILRKRSAEKSFDKPANGTNTTHALDAVANGNGTKMSPALQRAEPLLVAVTEEANGGALVAKNGDMAVDMDPSNAGSFLSAFSPPRWTNFRRVFSFNRSTPVPLAQEIDLNAPVSVTLEIRDESVTETPLDGTKAESCAAIEGNGGIPQEKSVIAPLLGLFSKARKSPKHFQRDFEPNSSVTGIDLPEKTNKTEQQVQSEEAAPEAASDKGASQEKSTEGNLMPEKQIVPKNDEKSRFHWSDIFTRTSKKFVLAGVLGVTFVIGVTLIIVLCQLGRPLAIDIGSLIIDGKFINTMTSCGQVQGLREDGGYAFRGIPYAVPPVGELRWRPAQPHSQLSHCWNGTYNATRHALPCWQFYRNGNYDGSEDCLYLDVYTPKPYYDAPLPVVVFVGGESLNGGESAVLRPSTELAVQKNVVFVCVSIRRSVLGFLTVEALSRNSYPMTSGNYGLSDLLAALNWVKINAQHFGGDHNHVTLLGHQAGSSLVLALLSSHQSKGLFHQVWVSAGSPPNSLLNVQEAEAQNEKFMKEVGCTSIECLHNKGPAELLESVPNDWRIFHQDLPNRGDKRHHWLVRDGLILREQFQFETVPLSQLPAEELIKLPFVAGGAAEVDASAEMFSYLNWNDTSKFSTYLESSLGSFGPSLPREVIDRYFRPESTPWQTFASILSDVRTICPLYYAATSRADSYAKLPVYFYVATQRRATPIGYIADAHADIAAIFGKYTAENREERKFVENMQKLFYDFVEKGGLPEMQDATKSILKVDENIQKIFTYPNCDFWQEHHFFPNHSRID